MLATLRRLDVVPSFSRNSVTTRPIREAPSRVLNRLANGCMNSCGDTTKSITTVLFDMSHRNNAKCHRGEDAALLDKRQRLYEATKARNPRRWSGETRNRGARSMRFGLIPPRRFVPESKAFVNHHEHYRTTLLINIVSSESPSGSSASPLPDIGEMKKNNNHLHTTTCLPWRTCTCADADCLPEGVERFKLPGMHNKIIMNHRKLLSKAASNQDIQMEILKIRGVRAFLILSGVAFQYEQHPLPL